MTSKKFSIEKTFSVNENGQVIEGSETVCMRDSDGDPSPISLKNIINILNEQYNTIKKYEEKEKFIQQDQINGISFHYCPTTRSIKPYHSLCCSSHKDINEGVSFNPVVRITELENCIKHFLSFFKFSNGWSTDVIPSRIPEFQKLYDIANKYGD